MRNVWVTHGALVGLMLASAAAHAMLGVEKKEGFSSNRVLVKFKPAAARAVEAALPESSLEIDAPAHPGLNPELRKKFSQHKIKKMAPLFREFVREKKRKKMTDRQLAEELRNRFPERAKRFKGDFNPPELSRWAVLELDSPERVQETIAALKADPDVEIAEQEKHFELQLVPSDPYFNARASWGQAYDDMYGLKKISAAQAWDTIGGDGVLVAVVDSGVDYTHPDISANMWVNRGYDFGGFDCTGGDNDPMDKIGHGTHVAGTIAASGNNGLGVIGVAWKAKIMAVKGFGDNGCAPDSVIVAALNYAVSNGADVINASFGAPANGTTGAIADAMNYAHNMGVVIVAAAGNDGVDAGLFTPANLPTVITVAASNYNDDRAFAARSDGSLVYFSNYGSKIDVAAPGQDILSLRAAGTDMYLDGKHIVGGPNGQYYRSDGTSMAAPHVAGLAALVLSAHPDYGNEQVRQVLRNSADPIGAPIVYPNMTITYFGSGRVNAARAVGTTAPLAAKIFAPSTELLVGSLIHAANPTGQTTFAVTATAKGGSFRSYTLDIGAGENPTSWTTLASGNNPLEKASLGTFDMSSFPDNRYKLRLRAEDMSGNTAQDAVMIWVNNFALLSTKSGFIAGGYWGTPVPLTTFSGTATGPNFRSYSVEVGGGQNPSRWHLIGGGAARVSNGTLASFDSTRFSDGLYWVRLTVEDTAGNKSQNLIWGYIYGTSVIANPQPLNPDVLVPIKSVAGATLSVSGTMALTSGHSFRLEWAKGIDPKSGWSTAGASAAGGGLAPVSNGLLGTWALPVVNEADYYTLRAAVYDESGALFNGEIKTRVYLDPELVSAAWPKRVASENRVTGIGAGSLAPGLAPVQDASGITRLTTLTRSQRLQFSYDGANLSPFALMSAKNPHPAAANLDGSIDDETVLLDGASPKLLKPNMAVTALVNPYGAVFGASPAALSDIDGDGVAEALGIGAVSAQEYLHIWRANGGLLAVFKISDLAFTSMHSRSLGNRIIVLDTDRDGQPEILVAVQSPAAASPLLRLFSPDGSVKAGWSEPTLPGAPNTTVTLVQMLAADLDRNGQPEIIVSACNLVSLNACAVHTLSAGGAFVGTAFTFPSEYNDAPYMAVGDINRDGVDELVAASGHSLGAYRFSNSAFSPLPGWPKQGGTSEFFGPPVIADVTGDGFPEVLVVNSTGPLPNPWKRPLFDIQEGMYGYSDTRLVAFQQNGSAARSWRLFGNGASLSSHLGWPLVGDFNRDGKVDIAVSYMLNNRPIYIFTSNNYQDHVAALFSLGVPYNPKTADWPRPLRNDANAATRLAPRVAIKLNGVSYAGNTVAVAPGSNLTFSWAAADADFCLSPAFGSPILALNGSTFRGSVQKTVYFDVECSNAAGKTVQGFTAVVNGLQPALTVITPAGGTYYGDNNNWWSNSNSMLWEKATYALAWQNTADIRAVTLELLKGQGLATAAIVDSTELSALSSEPAPTAFSWKLDLRKTFSGATRATPLSGGWYWLRARTRKGDVTGVNKNGFAFYISPDFMQPSTPGVPVVQSASFGFHTVGWTPSYDGESGVASYKLERWAYPSNTVHAVFTVTGTSFYDTGVPPGQYRYRVTAQDNAGISGFPSGVSTVVTVSAGSKPPTTPAWSFMSPQAAAPNASHSIYFAVATDGGGGVKDHEVSRSPDNGVSWSVAASNVGNVTGSYYTYTTLPGLPAGKYLYRVRAADFAGNWSGYSTPSPFYSVAPPFLSAYTNGQGNLGLIWTAPAGTPDAVIAHQVYIWGPFYDCPPNGSPVPYCSKFIMSGAARAMDFYNLRPNYNYYTMVQAQLFDATRGVSYWTNWSNMIWPVPNNVGTYGTAALAAAGIAAESLLTPEQRDALSRQRLSSLNRRLQPRAPLATAAEPGESSSSGLVFSTSSASLNPEAAALQLPGEPLPHQSSAPVALTLSYGLEELPAGLTTSDLALYRWDAAARQWALTEARHDAADRTFTVTTNEPENFAILAAGSAAAADEPFALGAVFSYPNPARGVSPTIRAETGPADSAELRIYNAADRLVHAAQLGAAGLVNGRRGYEYRWDAGGVPSGVYLYRVTAARGGENLSSGVKKLALIK